MNQNSRFQLPPNSLFLAPMEGVVDWVLREQFSQIGGLDYCTTEFIRVTDQLLPAKVIYRYAPELKSQTKTQSGTPVILQLLGGHPEPLLENALQLVALGAKNVDLNFGCPAKTVNRHDGGATLLKYPERISAIVQTLRRFLPINISVSAKIRLGYEDPRSCLENSIAIAEAGADWLTVHCRTKLDLYRPPAYWEWISRIKEKVSIPIVANGEIWTVKDYLKCKEITGAEHFMLGRGALADPFLFCKIKNAILSLPTKENELTDGPRPDQESWTKIKTMLPQYFANYQTHYTEQFALARTKQWLSQISRKNEAALASFNRLKLIHDPVEFKSDLERL